VQDFNRYVAIAEEFPNDAAAKVRAGGLLHDRKVSRIVTPGTLIDEHFMDPYTNNYVLAVHVERESLLEATSASQNAELLSFPLQHVISSPVGLAWLDLSTGQFYTQSTTLSMLPSVISRIGPSEIVLEEGLQITRAHALFSTLGEESHLVTYSPSGTASSVMEWSPMLESEVPAEAAAAFTVAEVAAGSLLLHYVATRLQGLGMRLQPPLRYQALETMVIDKSTMKALEIKETLRDSLFKGSLIHAVRRTVTKSGARLLTEWLGLWYPRTRIRLFLTLSNSAGSPSTSLKVINSRLDLVSRMIEDIPLREGILSLLRRSHDSQRLTQRFSLGRGGPEDLLALANTVIATQELVFILQQAALKAGARTDLPDADCLEPIISRFLLEGPLALAGRIKEAIDEEGIIQQQRIEDDGAGEMVALAKEIIGSEGSPEDIAAMAKSSGRKKPMSLREHYAENDNFWIMKMNATATLKLLHDGLNQLMLEKSALVENLQDRLRVPTLTLRWTPGLGHICHVKGKDTRIVADMRSVSSSRSTRSFHHPEWTQLGQKIDQAKVRIRAEEQQVFLGLREQVIVNLVKLRRNAAVLDELDVACSFATLAEEQALVRPVLNASSVHKIIGGRHPTVQGGLTEQGRSFVTNNCFVGDKENIWLITGPNMGGKSTFLRQNALITIMAQVGSYVPAEYAKIGIVDQIFSRVGSADNLYRDQSTFMVEMLETAMILKNATSRSFVIMDEIGRGTTPADGVAIAFACLHYLHHVNKCRTLFATHFHSLVELSKDMSGVGYYCTDVLEDDTGGFSYVHKLRKGVNRESHALKVARLAGIPELAIGVASEVMNKIYIR
jgi:DNA mismatch repair ATPase MutS